MRGVLSDSARLQHILESIDEILAAVAGHTFDSFCNDHVLRIAIVKWLEIIGEAANHITEETKNKNSQIDWRRIVALRNIVVHEYFRIDYAIIWDASTNLVPQLKTEIEKLKV